MKTSITVCVFLLSLQPCLFAQDHAPTVEQCRADQRLWSSVHDTQDYKDAMSRLSAQTLKQRSDEMSDCFAVDSENSHDYFAVVAACGMEMGRRYRHFIERHHLMAQFLAEDAAGKR
ncbi:MAG: hypothetical protein ABSG11_07480 [Candidatus Korobacteraceae bacterium]|jgi:hypothetical protein